MPAATKKSKQRTDRTRRSVNLPHGLVIIDRPVSIGFLQRYLSLAPIHRGVGRGGEVGLGRGVTLGVAVGVGEGEGVGVHEGPP
jgi:hypothetical protein